MVYEDGEYHLIFVLIVLWIASLLLLLSGWRNRSARWLSSVAFCGGSGALASVLQEVIRPVVSVLGGTATTDEGLYIAMTVFSLISYYGLPYCYVRFAGTYHGLPQLQPKWRSLHWLLLLPVVGMFLIHHYYPPDYNVLVYWAVPYIVIGTVLIVRKRGVQPWEQRSHQVTMIAVVPAVLFAMVMNYVMPALGIYEMWRYNVWTITLAFLIFVTALFKSGFLGVQLYIERRQMDRTLRAITSGTAILNHAIKNDIGKIQLYCDKLISSPNKDSQDELRQDVKVIARAATHIQEMVSRVQHNTQDLVLRPEPVQLETLISETIEMLRPKLTQSGIEVSTSWGDDQALMELVIDRAQVHETLHNIMMNAIEAMLQGGKLRILRNETKRLWIVSIEDTGDGIPKEHLGKVMNPFFTTKASSSNNFGLGLAYCYQVMKKHGGTMRIESRPSGGTTVYLHFAKNKRASREAGA
ncbi:sensor histidine kinase [Paenibacillus terrigena]|uniref:sensor histidine kinase n=1 Tax=Paenibacillus terrigena TaxID=369333 RepID=UPI00038295C8|nr:HAMP domain-containing sensor histidine kinase [Paenibacillus terrigena]